MPRNRELMRVFKDVGLVEQLGSGMSRILKAYDKSVFQITDHFIKAVFPFAEAINHSGIDNGTNGTIFSTNDTDAEKILLLMAKKPKITQEELRNETGISLRTVKRIVADLQKGGKVARIGNNRSGKWLVQ